MTEKKRTMYAPWSELGTRPPTVISVELGEDEDVEWIWTHTDDGESVVTGYAITQRTDKPRQSIGRCWMNQSSSRSRRSVRGALK
jgi:hypothetical protein